MLKLQVLMLMGVVSFTSSRSSSDFSSSGVSYVNISEFGQTRSIGGNGGQNGIGGRDSAQIVFPQSHKGSYSHDSGSKVPLHVLRALSSETDFAKVVRQYVKNVDIKKIQETGEQILVGAKDQEPIQDANGQQIVVSMAALNRPFLVSQPGSQSIQTPQSPAVSQRMGPTSRLGPTRAAPEKPPPIAVCRPEEQTVEVPVTFDPHIIYFPRCVRVERCGGCCGSDILACEPSEITTVNVAVRKLAYIGDGNNTNLEFVEQEDVPLEKHTKCECRCRVKEKDCGFRQVYKEHECLCACRNENEKDRCVADPQKTWDPVTCDCACREIKDCNSGFLFDLQTCQCSPILSSSQRRRRRNQLKKHT